MSSGAVFKKQVYETCLAYLTNKQAVFSEMMRELAEGALTDGKSAAGDKHETARSMMQLEQEKIAKQWQEVEIQLNILKNLSYLPYTGKKINQGSLVKTESSFLYLAVSIGKLQVAGELVWVLSPQSPLGMQLLGQEEGTTIQLKETLYILKEVQ